MIGNGLMCGSNSVLNSPKLAEIAVPEEMRTSVAYQLYVSDLITKHLSNGIQTKQWKNNFDEQLY